MAQPVVLCIQVLRALLVAPEEMLVLLGPVELLA
jgi:hypothetical protein